MGVFALAASWAKKLKKLTVKKELIEAKGNEAAVVITLAQASQRRSTLDRTNQARAIRYNFVKTNRAVINNIMIISRGILSPLQISCIIALNLEGIV